MAYIRDKAEELTGYQAGEAFRPSVDLGCDFVMVYGIDDTMPERIRQYRNQGYVIHLMTGIAWGSIRIIWTEDGMGGNTRMKGRYSGTAQACATIPPFRIWFQQWHSRNT